MASFAWSCVYAAVVCSAEKFVTQITGGYTTSSQTQGQWHWTDYHQLPSMCTNTGRVAGTKWPRCVNASSRWQYTTLGNSIGHWGIPPGTGGISRFSNDNWPTDVSSVAVHAISRHDSDSTHSLCILYEVMRACRLHVLQRQRVIEVSRQ